MRRIASKLCRSLARLVKVVRMTEAESFSRSFAVTFRFGEIYDFAKNAIRSANSRCEPPTAKFRRSPRFNIATRCCCRHKDVVTSFSPPQVTLKNFQSINKMRITRRNCGGAARQYRGGVARTHTGSYYPLFIGRLARGNLRDW